MVRDPAADWDARYATSGLVWSAEPNRWAEEVLGGLLPGRALDLGTGEGRHAVWLARRGWEVTAVDFSGEAIRKAAEHQRANAPETLGRITWVRADVVAEAPAPGSAMPCSSCTSTSPPPAGGGCSGRRPRHSHPAAPSSSSVTTWRTSARAPGARGTPPSSTPSPTSCATSTG
jgi:hypothetical protein